jgi:hypothetical protein
MPSEFSGSDVIDVATTTGEVSHVDAIAIGNGDRADLLNGGLTVRTTSGVHR